MAPRGCLRNTPVNTLHIQPFVVPPRGTQINFWASKILELAVPPSFPHMSISRCGISKVSVGDERKAATWKKTESLSGLISFSFTASSVCVERQRRVRGIMR
ncbi:hypothetical protein E2C01_095420 [Portunus trituberculatus]|uniref:Uncharacterized protein n=1 Tax=Portunus trituberculatus TaxID=210409 RepID=A0A5B7K039_PORTR|nr:hypothetical protein [Portunus trituberculatus]